MHGAVEMLTGSRPSIPNYNYIIAHEVGASTIKRLGGGGITWERISARSPGNVAGRSG